MGKLQRFLFKTFYHSIGRLSNGIQLALNEGFTSGKHLDYIYRNAPGGRWIIGNWIDKMYIRLEAWDAVRIRCMHLKQLIMSAINKMDKKNIHIVDIACGYAAYIFNVLSNSRGNNIKATCLDIDPRWIEDGNAKASELGINNVAFKTCNTLDRDSFLSISGKADIAVSSGFYDWISDEKVFQLSIKLVAEKLNYGGYFVLTHQLFNPYIELVAHTFNDHRGQPCRMRAYPAADVNIWLKSAGLSIKEELIDKWNYYRVTLAKKGKN
jgi:SAM-dependent methyltransferase